MIEENPQGTDNGGNQDNAEENRTVPPMPSWLRQMGAAAMAMRELAQAQWQLLGAEWRLARSAAKVALLAMVLGCAFAVALGLIVLALVCVLLAYWLGSWIWALVIVGAVLALCLIGSWMLMRRCLHWMSLPESRAQWQTLTHGLGQSKTRHHDAAGEANQHETASTLD